MKPIVVLAMSTLFACVVGDEGDDAPSDTDDAPLWRASSVSAVADLGWRRLEAPGGCPNGGVYSLRFKGMLLKDNASGHTFGMFTGKTAWGGTVAGTSIVVDNNRRGVEAQRVN